MDEIEIVVEDSGGRGRPSKFTTELRKRLIELLGRGVPFTYACHAAGISYSSFQNYREDESFEAEVQQAVALAIEKRLKVIERAADAGDVRAACWYLERIFPSHFGRTRLELVNGNQPPPMLALLDVPDKGERAAGGEG